MKTTMMALLTLATLSFSQVFAGDVTLSPAQNFSALKEGTETELSAAQIAELLPWAKDSKIFLVDLLEISQSLPADQKLERLVEGIKQVVIESAPKNAELIMRFTLNRALVVNDILTAEMNESAVGSSDAKLRQLLSSIRMALKYHDYDIAKLTKGSALPYAQFGIEYFNFLHELNKSIFDASAQYNVQRTALGFLQTDLNRDLSNTVYANQIVKIHNTLKLYPAKKMSDAQAISNIRQMKKVIEQLNLDLNRNIKPVR